MAEARDVRLYIYNDTSKGEGLSLKESRTFKLDNRENAYTEENESVDSLGVKTKTQTTTTNTLSYEVTLTKLEYRKKVYEPCQILANLQVGVVQEKTDVKTVVTTTYTDGKSSTDETIDKGHFKPVELVGNDQINLIKGKTVELEIDKNTIAKNYYVHKVRSVYKTVSGKTSLFVELTIYSRDKLMTLDKYSRAYTAKRLYTDILSEESQKFSSVEVANHMQLLKYQDTSTKATTRDELRIPYLVQYNESFYQFMVRSANRFGEFLYFEDGKLNLGMQPSDTNYYSGDTIIDWATKPNAVQNRYYESVLSEGISVEERAYSYMTHKPDENDEYASSDDSRYNIDPTSADEWTTQDLKKNEYIEFAEAWKEEMKFFVADIVYKALESHSISEALTALILEMAKKTYDSHKENKDYNNLLDETNWDTLENDDQKSGDSFKQFVTYSGSTKLSANLSKMFGEGGLNNFTDLFYQLIRKKEKEVGEQAVWLDFGNYYYPITLGDKLLVDKKDYVVISVEGSYENGQEHLLISAIPVYSLSDTDSGKQTATTVGDSWTSTCPFPPALPDVVIRDARPQVAFVAETLDPENMGRIRVRYPWQDEKGDPSPWIRVTLPLATTGGAVNFTPNEGDEVMVGYVHGNIEHPYAMGYLVAPFVNEKWKNAIPLDQYGGLHGIKVKTGHHLTFTDGANAASLVASLFGPLAFFKSMWPTGWWGAWPLGNETSSDLGGGFELSDRYGLYKISGSTDDRNITIESPVGTVNINAFQGISIEAPNGNIEVKGKNVSIEASNRLTLKSGENIEDKLWYRKEFSNTKAGWKAGLKASAISELKDIVKTAKSEVLDQILDMSFLRCVVEWFLVPVNGTLQIKSPTFVTIEAGEGSVEVPQESLRYGKGIRDLQSDSENAADIVKVINTLKCIAPKVSSLVIDIRNNYDLLCYYSKRYADLAEANGCNNGECIISYSDILKHDGDFSRESQDLNWDDSPLKYLPEVQPGDKPEENTLEYATWKKKADIIIINLNKRIERDKFVILANNLKTTADRLVTAVSKLTTFDKDDIIELPTGINKESLDLDTIAGYINALTIPTDKEKGVLSLDKMTGKSYGYTDMVQPSIDSWINIKIAMIRYVVYQYLSSRSYLTQDKNIIKSVNDAYDNKKWKKYVKSIDRDILIERLGKKKANELFNPFAGFVDDQGQWSHGFKGKILMSDEADKTAFFDKDLNMKPHNNVNLFDENISKLRELVNSI